MVRKILLKMEDINGLEMTCTSEESESVNKMSKDELNENRELLPKCSQSQNDSPKYVISEMESSPQVETKKEIDEQKTEINVVRRKGKKEIKTKVHTKRPRRIHSAAKYGNDISEEKASGREIKSSVEDTTKTCSPSSSHSVDNSLGETLATSLQLIATSGCSPSHSCSLLGESIYRRDALNYSTDYQASHMSPHRTEPPSPTPLPQPAPPSPTLSPQPNPLSPTSMGRPSPRAQSPASLRGPQSQTNASPYITRSSVKKGKRGRKPKKKIVLGLDSEEKDLSDSEMMTPVLHNDGSVTLFQCEICHKLFNKRQTLRQHFITHTDRFACQYCDARCKSKGDLRTHIQTHTKEKPYHCDICNTNYTRESILRKHLKTQLHLRAAFERENMVEIQKHREKKHIRRASQFIASRTKVRIDGFSCGQCSKVLLSKSDYRKHLKSHVLTHVCNVCQKGCKTALLLKIHTRSHRNENKLNCKKCSRKFSSLQSLKDHLKTHKHMSLTKETDESLIRAVINKHNKDINSKKVPEVDKKPQPKVKQSRPPTARKATFECNVCHRMFTSEKRLSNHSHTHKGNFSCDVCSKLFPNLFKLTNHMVEHEKPLVKCEICHASYADEGELKAHVESQHCEGSELVCKICYKSFESAIDVYKHMNDHAPTMLFSGDCLDENAIPVAKGAKKVTPLTMFKVSESEESSDDEKKTQDVAKNSEGPPEEKQILSDKNVENSELTTVEFIEIIDAVREIDTKEVDFDDFSDFEDDFLTCIVEVLESEVLSSAESDLGEDLEDEEGSSIIEKPILYCHGDIVRKHGEEFERYSHRDPSKNLFQCTLCVIGFEKEKSLSDHLKCHVCEYCNKFFIDAGKLSVHKSNHVKRLLSRIDIETKKMHHPKQKWKQYFVDSSDTEVECEDHFLNELEDILESDSAKTARAANFLKTLSHDDIVKANKPLFDEHSFVDVANNIFACTICKRKYARPTTLTRHFKTHVCQYCNTFFIDKSDLLEHKYRHRKRAALMKAELTGEGSKMPPSPVVSKENRTLFKRFSFVDSERNINRCTLCSKNFVRRTVLTRHLKTHICSHCDKFFEDKFDLVKHTTFHKVEKHYTEDDGDDEGEDFIEFDEDSKPFPQASPSTLGIGQKALSIPSSFSSSLPPYSSSFHVQPSCNNRNDPITYIQLPGSGNVGPDSSQVYTNQNNGSSTFQIISQPVNVYKDNGPDSFIVSSTNCQSNGQDKIITISQPQILQGESGERERLFECGECGKRFFKNGHLKSHMNIHTGSRPYVCSVCGKAFGRGTTLRKHEKTHLKKCKICDTTFASKYELDLHLEIHRTYAFYK